MDKEKFTSNVFSYIHLLSLYLNKKKANDFKVDESNIAFFAKLSKRHSLIALFYKALVDTHAQVSEENLKKLEEYYFANVRKVALFEKERKELYKFLNDNQIDFLPLKGIIIQHYYLDPNSREFADNDILFNDAKDKEVKKFFKDRDYKVESFKKSNHDAYIKKPFFNFEMHRALFTDNEDRHIYAKYFKDYLKNSPVKEGYEHYLSNEHFFTYFIAHAYKHFNNSGCGIRTLIDCYLYLKQNQLDFNYINQELDKMNLTEFSNKFCALSNKLFDEQELNEEEKEMLLFIASSGTYGTLENSVNKGVKEKGKFKYFMLRIFPPMSFYRDVYPWAYKTKVLIPVAWIVRTIRIIFRNPKKAAKELKMISKVKKEKKSD